MDLGSSQPLVTPAVRRRAAPRRPRAVDALAALLGLGLGVTIAIGVTAQAVSSLSTSGAVITFAGRMAGLVGGYAMLVTVLLAGRLPLVERTLGHDRLLAWHRRLAPAALVLIASHGLLTLLGYAQQARTGMAAEAWILVSTLPWVLAATAGFVALAAAGVTSYRRARRRMSHETWWAVHLYTYLGLALSFPHQVVTGSSFVGRGWAQLFWIALWAGTAGAVLAFRVGLPLWRSLRHRLRVEKVVEEGPGVVSVLLRGRKLDRLPLSGGQWAHWRFGVRGLWWQAHPYSISALPADDRLRITVADLGDHSGGLRALRPGTRVAFEGPYGAFTAEPAARRGVLLVGAGVGTTPIRALLEELEPASAPVVLLRGSDARSLPLAGEIDALVRDRGGRVEYLIGPRQRVRVDGPALRRLVPDIRRREVYVCGPSGFIALVVDAAAAAGVPASQLHHETFDF